MPVGGAPGAPERCRRTRLRRVAGGPFLEADEKDQLRLLGWCLLILNLILVGVGLLLGRAMEDRDATRRAIVAAAVLVDGAFLLVVGGNLAWLLARRWWDRR